MGFGGMLATSAGAACYGRYLDEAGKRRAVLACSTASTAAALALLAHCAPGPPFSAHAPWATGFTLGPNSAALALSLLGLGFGSALPFYVPANVLTLQLAQDARHTASLSNLLDAAGFAALVPFEVLAGTNGAAAVAALERQNPALWKLGGPAATRAAQEAAGCWTQALAALAAACALSGVAMTAAMRLATQRPEVTQSRQRAA
mmetsp:Transcript_6859/g.15731  ORF Transcript_6859/g.15731 Transcript_6859/m.15731 type:complete len:204 (+) Transcript_6859:137-748(+)